MELNSLAVVSSALPVPPSYEQCVKQHSAPKADYVVSPLVLVAVLGWDDEEDDW